MNSKNKLILTTNSINPDIEFTRKKSTSKRKIKNSTLDNNFMNQDIEFTDNKSQILNNKNDILDNNYTNSNTEEKDFITIKKILPFKLKKEKENSIITEEYNIPNNNNLNNISLLSLIKREQKYLRTNYESYMEKQHPNPLTIILAEILDKVYFVKICIFLKKYELFSIQLSLYLFCHILLLSLLCAFFTIETIRKIWEQTNFPSISFYLLYGFITHIIIWIIYKIFLCLLDMDDKIEDLVNKKNENNNEDVDDTSEENITKKYLNLIKKFKLKIIIFYSFIFGLIIFCSIYLVTFFGIYTGTKKKVMNAYYISLIEIILIKFVYGVILASLRIASKASEIEKLYKIVYIFNKYIS